MTAIKLKHVDSFRDRYGRRRYYFRRGHGARVALPGEPGSAAFMTAYQAALAGKPEKSEPRKRGSPGTFDRLTQLYFSSPEYLRLTPGTQRTYSLVIERLIRGEKIGHRLVAEMTREHVKRIVAKRAATPGAANDVLKKLRILVRFAIDNGWRSDDPCLRIKTFPEGEWHTWTDEEIATYEARWPIGSAARTAFALLLFTGQRMADVSRMAWLDVGEGAIRIVQGKTGTKLSVPLHPDLGEVLAAWLRAHERILPTAFGKPFTPKGFGNWMADKIGKAGVPDRCVTHGLRKAAARRLAEAGCSANEIAAITGHATLTEVSRYTRAAEQRTLARSAIGRLAHKPSAHGVPNPSPQFGKISEKSNDINIDLFNWCPRRDSNPHSLARTRF